jgi:iron complex outermembrane recepter protein
MKNLLKKALLFSFTALSIGVKAQQNSTILTGMIVANQQPLESVMVSLLNAKDSSTVKSVITDKTGIYSIQPATKGKYLLLANLVGFEKAYLGPFDWNGLNQEKLPNWQLKPLTKGLAEVTVNSKKPMIEQKADRTIINVDASPTNGGANAMEILEKSPGISVDKDGNISLKGKEGVMVYMDGRPTYLSGPDLVNLLKNTQGAQLDQIEIMTNPPARFDAAGNAGVINIKTKKSKVVGFNGSVTAGYGQGVYSRNNQTVQLNYRKNKFNVFGNIGRNERTGFQNIAIDRRFIDGGSKQIVSFFEQITDRNTYNHSYNGKIGLDFYASSKTTLGLVFNGFNNKGNGNSIGDINIFNAQHILMNKTLAYNGNVDTWKNTSLNFNLRHVLDSSGREISFDADYLTYDGSTNLFLKNAYQNNIGQTVAKTDSLYGQLPQMIDIYTAKIDYIHPLKNKAKFEAGLKTSFVTTDANAIYDTLFNGVMMRDYNRSNHFVYRENINAGYLNYSRPIGAKWNMQLGLRAEQTIAKGDQKTTNEQFKRNYIQLFPTAYVQYAANEANSFVLNYGKRIRRPDYQSLNPFVEFLDRYTYEQGNPYLRPQFSHNIELSHTYKGFLTTTLNYTKTTDIIQQVLMQDDIKNETFIKQENIATQQQIGLSINAFNQYTKWWSGNIYLNVANNQLTGPINNEPVSISANTFMANISQQFKLNKGYSAELSGFYRTEGLEGIFRIKGFGVVNIGVSKQIMKNKGTIRLNVRDIFWSQRIKGESRYGTVDANFRQFNDNRIANISFTYRFSKGKATAGPRKRGGADDEQSRVGVDGGK